MNRHEARKEAMQQPFNDKEGFVIIKLSDGSISWQRKGTTLPDGASIVEQWIWYLGWRSKILAFDKPDKEYVSQFFDIEALFAIDWTTLSFPGIAWNEDELRSFPYQLCDLTSPHPGVWRNASDTLRLLVEDCIISNLTTQALPFLLQLVRNPTVPYRLLLLEYLLPIAEAFRYQSDAKHHLSSYDCFGPPKPDEQRKLEKTHRLIAAVCPMFIECLTHVEAGTREQASHILACFPEQVAIIWPPLEQAFLREQNELVKAAFLKDLSLLAAGNPNPLLPWFEQIRLTHPDELVRFVATLRLAHLTRHHSSHELVASLINLLQTEPEALRHQYTAFIGGMNP